MASCSADGLHAVLRRESSRQGEAPCMDADVAAVHSGLGFTCAVAREVLAECGGERGAMRAVVLPQSALLLETLYLLCDTDSMSPHCSWVTPCQVAPAAKNSVLSITCAVAQEALADSGGEHGAMRAVVWRAAVLLHSALLHLSLER